MATQTWRNQRQSLSIEKPTPVKSKASAGGGSSTRILDRATARRWRTRHNPFSLLVWLAGWAAALILLAGMGLTWWDANTGNRIFDAVMEAGRWLATPFANLFANPDPDKQLYVTWGLAAGVYYVLGRILSWLIRR